MESGLTIVVGGPEGQHVRIRPIRRAHPDQPDYWDGNWIASRIELAVDGFRAGYDADLRAEDFARFLDGITALQATLSGTAEFETMEDQLRFSLAVNTSGHIAVQGQAVSVAGHSNRLAFTFQIDQSYLLPLREQLIRVVEAFPVIGNPNA